MPDTWASAAFFRDFRNRATANVSVLSDCCRVHAALCFTHSQSPKPQLRLQAQPLHCLALRALCISSIEWLFSRASIRTKKQSHRNKGRTHAWHHRKYMTTSLRWQSRYALVVSKSSFRMFPCSFPSARAVGIVHHMITWYPLQKKQWPNGNPTAFLAQEKWEPFCECLTKCGHFLQQMEEFRMIGRRKLWREQQEMHCQWRSLLCALVNHFGFPTLLPWVKRAESTKNNWSSLPQSSYVESCCTLKVQTHRLTERCLEVDFECLHTITSQISRTLPSFVVCTESMRSRRGKLPWFPFWVSRTA